MSILESINDTANTIFRISTHEWTKNDVARLGITSTIIIGANIIIRYFKNKKGENL